MGRRYPEPTFKYFIRKNGKWVDLKSLSEEEQEYVGQWAYRKILEGLGYRPVQQHKEAKN